MMSDPLAAVNVAPPVPMEIAVPACCVMLPARTVTASVLACVVAWLTAPRIRPLESTIEMFFAPLLRRLTGPVKSLPVFVSVNRAPLVSKVAAPAPAAWTIAAVWVIAPEVVTLSVPVPSESVPRLVVPESLISTEAVPLVVTLMVPPKMLDSARITSALATDAVNEAEPLGTLSTLPDCWVIAPEAEIVRV